MAWKTPEQPYNTLPPLPPLATLESPVLLKAALQANKYLAELKGYCHTLPAPEMLLNTLILQESRDSSAVENIVTTQEELYQAIGNPGEAMSPNVKEVISYRQATYTGWEQLKEKGLFTAKLAVNIMQSFKHTGATYRKVPGTKLKNPATGQVVYSPPDPQYIEPMLSVWERYLNTANEQTDPLIVMALMHYQFEAIHPFSDGNGRTGRILNVLYLLHSNLLHVPVLYHSRYIIQNRTEYYRNLRRVTEEDAWEHWILYMLGAIKETAQGTLKLIKDIISLKAQSLQEMKTLSQKLPAHELNEVIFTFPYTKIKMLEEKGIAKRQAASTYLQKLAAMDVLRAVKSGKEIYYINHRLMALLESNPS